MGCTTNIVNTLSNWGFAAVNKPYSCHHWQLESGHSLDFGQASIGKCVLINLPPAALSGAPPSAYCSTTVNKLPGSWIFCSGITSKVEEPGVTVRLCLLLTLLVMSVPLISTCRVLTMFVVQPILEWSCVLGYSLFWWFVCHGHHCAHESIAWQRKSQWLRRLCCTWLAVLESFH